MRMYASASPKLFLGIGLLFIPVGLITAGIQYLLFRVGFLAPLVDSVGASNAFVEILVFLLSVFLTLARADHRAGGDRNRDRRAGCEPLDQRTRPPTGWRSDGSAPACGRC